MDDLFHSTPRHTPIVNTPPNPVSAMNTNTPNAARATSAPRPTNNSTTAPTTITGLQRLLPQLFTRANEHPPRPIELRPIAGPGLLPTHHERPTPPMPPPRRMVEPYHIFLGRLINRLLDHWTSVAIPTSTLLADELTAASSGPWIRAEQQEEGADERVLSGRRLTGQSEETDSDGTSSHVGQREEENGMSQDVLGGHLARDWRQDPRPFWDRTIEERQQILAQEQVRGGDTGIWLVQSIIEGYGAWSTAGWEELGFFRAWLSRVMPCLYQTGAEPFRHTCNPRYCFCGLIGVLIVPFAAIYYLLHWVYRRTRKIHRPVVIIITTYCVLRFAFGVDALKLTIAILKALPGFF